MNIIEISNDSHFQVARICTDCRRVSDFHGFPCSCRRIHPTEVCKAFSDAAYITTQSMRHHAWDHQETTRLRVAVLATQAGKSQVSMVLEMWFYADGGVAGVETHDISAKDIASIFKHGWVARANVNRYRDQQPTACWIFGKSQAVLIWLSCSRDVDVGYGSCIYSINTYFYHMT